MANQVDTPATNIFLFELRTIGNNSFFPKKIYFSDIKLAARSVFKASVKSVTISDYSYHPEKTIFTAASVGGVTTGGFHTQQAYYTSHDKRSGKGEVLWDSTVIDSILLSPDLAEAAKNIAPISQCLDGDVLRLSKGKVNGYIALEAALHPNSVSLSNYSAAKANVALGINICEAIVDFLWTSYQGFFLPEETKLRIADAAIRANDPYRLWYAMRVLKVENRSNAKERLDAYTKKLNEYPRWKSGKYTFFSKKAYIDYKRAKLIKFLCMLLFVLAVLITIIGIFTHKRGPVLGFLMLHMGLVWGLGFLVAPIGYIITVVDPDAVCESD